MVEEKSACHRGKQTGDSGGGKKMETVVEGSGQWLKMNVGTLYV